MGKKNIPKVLIVDDVPANIFALEQLLQDLDIEIHTATGGYEALKLTIEHSFAVVLLDVQMPELDRIISFKL